MNQIGRRRDYKYTGLKFSTSGNFNMTAGVGLTIVWKTAGAWLSAHKPWGHVDINMGGISQGMARTVTSGNATMTIAPAFRHK